MVNGKIFMSILLSIAMTALSVEVISIDINDFGNDAAYSEVAAVPDAVEWVAYSGGWGTPVGSPRSANLAQMGTIQPSTYAEQVWLGDRGGHDYISGSGSGLLDDGFVSFTPSVVPTEADPNLAFIGLDMFGDAGDLAYGGVFDLYIYGNSAGTYTLKGANNEIIAGPVAITGTTSGLVEGENYVLFENLNVANPDSLIIYYSNELCGIQLVSTKDTPKIIIPDSSDPNDYKILSPAWDVAYDTNARDDEDSYGFGSYYGPDSFGNMVGILYDNDSMDYDFVIEESAQGKYNLTVDMDTTYGETTINLFLDGKPLGSLTGSKEKLETVGPLPINLFTGLHTLRWQSAGYYGGNVGDIVFNFVGGISLHDCEDVYRFGLEPAGDLNGDCRVDMDDLAMLISEWLSDYNPF